MFARNSSCDTTWSFSWSAEHSSTKSICCSCHWCISHPLQTVKGCSTEPYYLGQECCTCTSFPDTAHPTMLIVFQGFTFCVLSLSLWLCMHLSKPHLLQNIPNSPGLSAGLGAWLALQVKAFLGKLDADYAEYAPALWHAGIKTPRQLANLTEPHYLACDVRRGHIDDIKARADTIGELLACHALYKGTCWLEWRVEVSRYPASLAYMLDITG